MKDQILVYTIEKSYNMPDYFHGMGIIHTDFENIVIGCGASEKIAFEDAIDQMKEIYGELDPLMFGDLQEEVYKLSNVESTDEWLYYIGIKWSIKEIETKEGE